MSQFQIWNFENRGEGGLTISKMSEIKLAGDIIQYKKNKQPKGRVNKIVEISPVISGEKNKNDLHAMKRTPYDTNF